MLIKSRMGISADGFVATPDGWPALVTAPGFVPAVSHGYPEFIEGVDAVVMGRSTFVPALGSPDWPVEGPAGVRADVPPAARRHPGRGGRRAGRPGRAAGAAAVPRLGRRRAPGRRAAHHRGLPRVGALDRLELVVLPILLGAGVLLSPAGTEPLPLRLDSTRRFPDGSVESAYAAK